MYFTIIWKYRSNLFEELKQLFSSIPVVNEQLERGFQMYKHHYTSRAEYGLNDRFGQQNFINTPATLTGCNSFYQNETPNTFQYAKNQWEWCWGAHD